MHSFLPPFRVSTAMLPRALASGPGTNPAGVMATGRVPDERGGQFPSA